MGVVRIVEVMGKFARATSSIYSRHELQARASGGSNNGSGENYGSCISRSVFNCWGHLTLSFHIASSSKVLGS